MTNLTRHFPWQEDWPLEKKLEHLASIINHTLLDETLPLDMTREVQHEVVDILMSMSFRLKMEATD